MYWFFTALIAGIVVAIALVATGRGDSMARAWPDRRYLSLPEDRSLTAHDLESLRLAVAFRGYRMDEVDDLLDRLSVELAARDADIERLHRELADKSDSGEPASDLAASGDEPPTSTAPSGDSDEARSRR